VKTLEALKQMGGRALPRIRHLGDSAYQVQQGFLADANALRRAAKTQQGEKEASRTLLAQFLLDNLQ